MDLAGAVLQQGGPWAIITFAVVAVLRGQIVPRSTFDAKAREADYWRETATEALRQNGEMVELSRTSVHVLSSLPNPGEEVRGHGSSDVDAAPPR